MPSGYMEDRFSNLLHFKQTLRNHSDQLVCLNDFIVSAIVSTLGYFSSKTEQSVHWILSIGHSLED